MNCNHCLFYVFGLLAACAYDEISFNKIATQSHNPPTGTGYYASNAVDGNTATCMRTNIIGGTFAPYNTVWWKVDLGEVYNIYSIHILYKSYQGYDIRQRGRFAGCSLYVSNTDVSTPANIKGSTICYKNGPQLPPLNFTTICTESGRYVIFYNERFKEVKYPDGYEVANVLTELCEVTIQGCNNASVYGNNCDIPCPTNCKDSKCHIQNGTCFNCKPGWTGKYCDTKCEEGWYGNKCTQQCLGHCRDGASCNHVTGQCDKGCAAGWTGLQCIEECISGIYGYYCINNCSGHCLNDSPCNKQTGHCDRGCNPGYTNDYCNKECPSGHFGLDCSERCSGYCTNKEPCDHVSGDCPSGCQDGYIGTHCNNACKEGYFGTNCSRECSPNCKPDTCRHTDGWCTTCAAGYTGYNCTTECMLSYGKNCQYPCSAYCINQICDIINGSCLYGCKEGERCDEACAPSNGENCRPPCSLQCYNHTCDRFTRRCLLGCKDGFYGEYCDRENVMKIQNVSISIMLILGLSVSALINLIFIVYGYFLCRRKKPSKLDVSGNLVSCWNRSIYQDIAVKTEEDSNYQELNLSGNTYQNTVMQ